MCEGGYIKGLVKGQRKTLFFFVKENILHTRLPLQIQAFLEHLLRCYVYCYINCSFYVIEYYIDNVKLPIYAILALDDTDKVLKG